MSKMAKKDDNKQLEKIVAKSNSLIYGTENALSTESD
jgi:hypothetical protein